MARTVQTIKAKMLADIAADATLSSKLTSPSMTAIYNLWCYIVASAINLFEQVQDLYITNAESLALKTPPATPLWIQNQVFNYQYDSSGLPATNVVVINSDFSVGYATKDSTFNIVSLCSVNTATNNLINIKVAQGNSTTGYSAITGTARTQLNGFLTEILPAGINHNLISQDADYLAIYGSVYYQNGYAGVIQSNVRTAIKNYIDSISISNSSGSQSVNYTGIVKVSEIENAILNADGVTDVNLTKILGRSHGTAFTSATVTYDLSAGVNGRFYLTSAGYVVEEVTASNTWNDTLTYTASL
ncbi:hypothetical protein UFOVP87_21 [uncultured Caudovirales phage]|uniref:Uncharacterized protein n=1 Tax=uncultured Caudovirales phage TaxID=2100421 RepID=A0A6J5L0X0_9CAUD|nr:hypothetical protein UFOVP87_21 [uncultured Caudovirales phage]